MRYDILKLVFSHTFSLEEAKVAPSGESVWEDCKL